MYEILIQKYLKMLSLKDINNFAEKNNMTLLKGEDKVIYDYIMKYWKVIYKEDPTFVFNNLKKEVSLNTYNNVISLYNEYKEKIK